MAKDTISNFINETIAAAGFADAPDDVKNTFRERVELAFSKRLGVESLALLSGKDIVKFQKMVAGKQKATPQILFEFFNSHIPQFETKVAGVMKNFQDEFVRAAKAVAV